jgi:hypothetical protein
MPVCSRGFRRLAAWEAAASLADVPQLKRLHDLPDFYRVRLGGFRQGLHVQGARITCVRCLHRREIYRYFPGFTSVLRVAVCRAGARTTSSSRSLPVKPDTTLSPRRFVPKISRLFEFAAAKISSFERSSTSEPSARVQRRPALGQPAYALGDGVRRAPGLSSTETMCRGSMARSGSPPGREVVAARSRLARASDPGRSAGGAESQVQVETRIKPK